MAALRNLVENAITASPEGATVDVTLATSDGRLLCAVADRGPGIAEGDRARVTDHFYRGRQSAEGGSGLGLAIVATAMERLGGSFSLRPRDGGGEIATLILPEPRQARR